MKNLFYFTFTPLDDRVRVAKKSVIDIDAWVGKINLLMISRVLLYYHNIIHKSVSCYTEEFTLMTKLLTFIQAC